MAVLYSLTRGYVVYSVKLPSSIDCTSKLNDVTFTTFLNLLLKDPPFPDSAAATYADGEPVQLLVRYTTSSARPIRTRTETARNEGSDGRSIEWFVSRSISSTITSSGVLDGQVIS